MIVLCLLTDAAFGGFGTSVLDTASASDAFLIDGDFVGTAYEIDNTGPQDFLEFRITMAKDEKILNVFIQNNEDMDAGICLATSKIFMYPDENSASA